MEKLVSRKPRSAVRCCVFAAAVGAASVFATVSSAGELPKEGTFSIANTTTGKVSRADIGNVAMFALWDETGTITGEGLLKGAAWHCYGITECMKGTCEAPHAYCVGTAPDGGRIVFRMSVKYSDNLQTALVTAESVIGSGQYEGVTASFEAKCIASMAVPPEYANECEGNGSYKLP